MAHDRRLTPDEFDERAVPLLRDVVPDLDVDAWRAVIGLVRAVDRIVADLETNVQRPLGLSWSGFRVLFALWMAGPLSTTSLSRLLATTPPTVSSVLNTLERRGLLVRRAVPDDRRAVSISLTDDGTRTVASAFQAQHVRERAWTSGIPADDLTVLIRTLDGLLRRPRPPAEP